MPNTENKIAAVEHESKEQVQAALLKSKADANARREAFKSKVKARQAASAQQWQDLQASYNQKVLQIRNKIDSEKEAREAKRARRGADELVSYAEDAISLAMLAIDDAEVAWLEAIDAEANTESLGQCLVGLMSSTRRVRQGRD
jgi:Holliday junction resolvase RusA-like endonuclease